MCNCWNKHDIFYKDGQCRVDLKNKRRQKFWTAIFEKFKMAATRKYWKNEKWQNDILYHFSNIFGAKEPNENDIFMIWGQGHLIMTP